MFDRKIRNALIVGALSAVASVQSAQATVTTYNVTERFNQVVYNSAPDRDTYFTGTFDFDSATQTVSNLQGLLSQAMTNADPALQATRYLSHQLSSVYDAALGGLLVSSFYQNTTDVFQGGGFATGGMRQFGNQNAYVTIFVNLLDPEATLTPAQNYKLAYGDCTTGSLMGGMGTCMTGWLSATGTTGGTMRGVDQITQTITAAVPEPETYAMFMAGLGLIGFIARRRRTN
ncbi:PEP-CTERM sorting domain-containing protein [Ferribacterium limneticum]|uniref:PEP-CTERM sorting domain-containing protein n=1 Tax=Ferribacterium limneticum TaxID=76259 RepID=UPI001CF9C98F|nr:PEP-CTERM sorting domain-containing protein [Ferribacterium limneticum]